MKTVVPLWTLLAYGAVGAATYLATDWVFGDRDGSAPVSTDRLSLQDAAPESAKPAETAETSDEVSTAATDSTASPSPALPDDEQEAIADGDADVDEILTELELIYQESDDNFIPTEPVSPDRTIDFPVDI